MILAEGSLHMHSTSTDLQFGSILQGFEGFLEGSRNFLGCYSQLGHISARSGGAKASRERN
jgi:hypothetical protein